MYVLGCGYGWWGHVIFLVSLVEYLYNGVMYCITVAVNAWKIPKLEAHNLLSVNTSIQLTMIEQGFGPLHNTRMNVSCIVRFDYNSSDVWAQWVTSSLTGGYKTVLWPLLDFIKSVVTLGHTKAGLRLGLGYIFKIFKCIYSSTYYFQSMLWHG